MTLVVAALVLGAGMIIAATILAASINSFTTAIYDFSSKAFPRVGIDRRELVDIWPRLLRGATEYLARKNGIKWEST